MINPFFKNVGPFEIQKLLVNTGISNNENFKRDKIYNVSDLLNATRKDLTFLPFITIDGEDAKDFDDAVYAEKVNNNNCNLIDIRDVRELERLGRIENSSHIPRGMLEFWMDPDSQYFKEGKIDMNKEIVLFCAGGLRSALATKTLQNMGFTNISHIDGGFGSMQNSGFKIVK